MSKLVTGMRLYLLQHGEACSKEMDPERALTAQGRLDIDGLGLFLGQAGIRADRVMHSGKLRARQTAERLATDLAPGVSPEVCGFINPADDPGAFAELTESWTGDTLVVGHLPFLARLVSFLTTGESHELHTAFQPGSIVCLQRGNGPRWQIDWMIRPELLRRSDAHISPQTLNDFWFDPEHEKLWFRSTPQFDQLILERFERLWFAARSRQLSHWEQTAESALALVILLDQLPLNMYRGQRQGFATEKLSLEVARRAVSRGLDQQLPDKGKAFLYMPFMHSEDLADQDRAVELYEAAGLSDNLRFARHHRDIVRRFGRFPHRNAILGRSSTPEEQAWLTSGKAFLG